MAKRSRTNSVDKNLKDGRGMGIGLDYKPWLKIQDFSSSGRSTRLKGITIPRQYEFLSDLERTYFHLSEHSDYVVEIREQYPLLPLEETSYPSETLKKIALANIVITSDLKRSVESAKLLNPNLKAISIPLFRETELPVPSAKLLGLKLNPSIWAVILRCLWFCGYSMGCESLSYAKQRAQKASKLLNEYAQKNKSVALVGHGFFNMLIAKELKKWVGKAKEKRIQYTGGAPHIIHN